MRRDKVKYNTLILVVYYLYKFVNNIFDLSNSNINKELQAIQKNLVYWPMCQPSLFGEELKYNNVSLLLNIDLTLLISSYYDDHLIYFEITTQ